MVARLDFMEVVLYIDDDTCSNIVQITKQDCVKTYRTVQYKTYEGSEVQWVYLEVSV